MTVAGEKPGSKPGSELPAHAADRAIDGGDADARHDAAYPGKPDEKGLHDLEVEAASDKRDLLEGLMPVARERSDLKRPDACLRCRALAREGGRGQRVIMPPAVMRWARSIVSRAS